MEAITQLSRDFLWVGSANEGLGATFIVKSRRDDLLGQKTPLLSVQSNLFSGFLKVPGRLGLKSAVRTFTCIVTCTITFITTLSAECRGFKSHPRQLIFLRKTDCLRRAVLLCFVVCLTLLASFFLPSHLSLA